MRLLCIAGNASAAAVQLAMEAARLEGAGFTAWPEAAADAAATLADGYDAVCVLEPAPGGAAALTEAVTRWGRAGKTVILAGPAADTREVFDAAQAAASAAGGALLGLSQPGFTLAGRAVITAAQQRTAGIPVYLRYAAEEGTPAGLTWHLSVAIDFAAAVLGESRSLYVTAVPAGGAEPVHLAALVRHDDDCISLLGAGSVGQDRRDSASSGSGGSATGPEGAVGPARLASTLYLGNRGAMEMNLVSGGVLLDAEAGRGLFGRMRDDRHDALTVWMRAADALARGEGRPAAQATAQRMAAAADAVRRSLDSGRAAVLQPAGREPQAGEVPVHA